MTNASNLGFNKLETTNVYSIDFAQNCARLYLDRTAAAEIDEHQGSTILCSEVRRTTRARQSQNYEDSDQSKCPKDYPVIKRDGRHQEIN